MARRKPGVSVEESQSSLDVFFFQAEDGIRDIGGDWSSDVCSSDLRPAYAEPEYRYVEPRRVYRGGLRRAHVDWCYSRYRSYRAYDNSFQPYHGPRQICYSPYS